MSEFDNPFEDTTISVTIEAPKELKEQVQQLKVHPQNINPFDPNLENIWKNTEKPLAPQMTQEPELVTPPLLPMTFKTNTIPIPSNKVSLSSRRNNWPSFPVFCCVQPCFFQDINIDIPLEFQPIVKELYNLWLLHELILICNIIGGLVINNPKIITLGLFYLIILTPMSYIFWFRPIYKAFQMDSSFNFVVFFFNLSVQCIFTGIQALGFPSSGAIGLYTTLGYIFFNSQHWNILTGIIIIFITAGFATACIMDILLLRKVHGLYKNTGASFIKAQQEFTEGVFNSQYVRNVANEAAIAAIKIQFK